MPTVLYILIACVLDTVDSVDTAQLTLKDNLSYNVEVVCFSNKFPVFPVSQAEERSTMPAIEARWLFDLDNMTMNKNEAFIVRRVMVSA